MEDIVCHAGRSNKVIPEVLRGKGAREVIKLILSVALAKDFSVVVNMMRQMAAHTRNCCRIFFIKWVAWSWPVVVWILEVACNVPNQILTAACCKIDLVLNKV